MKLFNLSEEQQKAFNFLHQFYHPFDNRGMGRTYVMACLAIMYAIENPGLPVRLVDHTGFMLEFDGYRHQEQRHLAMRAENIISKMPEHYKESVRFNRQNMTLRYAPQEPLQRKVILKDEFLNDLPTYNEPF